MVDKIKLSTPQLLLPEFGSVGIALGWALEVFKSAFLYLRRKLSKYLDPNIAPNDFDSGNRSTMA